ncbi:hypothetical protein TWF281_002787 [Arthrobotrys megalospora]
MDRTEGSPEPSEHGDAQSTPLAAPVDYSEPPAGPIQIAWDTSSPAFTDTSPIRSKYSVDIQAAPRGFSLRDRSQWARENPSAPAAGQKRKRSPSPAAPNLPAPQLSPEPSSSQEPAAEEVAHERPNSPERPAWLSFSEAMYAPMRENTGLESGRSTPHMLRIPPETPPPVHSDDDEESRERKKRRWSPSWGLPLEEAPQEAAGPASPAPFVIHVDEPTPIPRKRKRQSIEDGVVEEGGSSPRPRKKQGTAPAALSEGSSLPTPIFHPTPVEEEEEESGQAGPVPSAAKEQAPSSFAILGGWRPSNPAIVLSGAHVEGTEPKKKEDAPRSLAIAPSNPRPSRPVTFGEIRSRHLAVVPSSSHTERPEGSGSVSGKPAIVLSDARPQAEGVVGENGAEKVRETPPLPFIVDSPSSSPAPSRGRSPCPTPRRLLFPKKHTLDQSPYITADRFTDEALRQRRLGTSFGKRLLDAQMEKEGEFKEGSASSNTETKRKPSSILKLFEMPELFARISDKLSEKDCANLTSTCKALREKKEQLWDINKHLSHFLKKPTDFRSLMATHGAVVSGSDALQFLSRQRFENSDLDVYVEVKGVREFSKHLEEVEGYTWVPYQWQSDEIEEAINDRIPDMKYNQKLEHGGRLKAEENGMGYLARYEMRKLEGVFLFQKGNAEDQSLRQVQLIVTQGPPMYAILSDFYATHLFNFYDYKRAYSLFPRGTFVERRGYKTQAMTAKLVRCCAKYTQRGYDILDYTGWNRKSTEEGKFSEVVLEVKDEREIRRSRRVGDSFSWFLDLDITGVDVPEHPPSALLEYATFGMGYTNKCWNLWGEEMVRENPTPYMKVKCAPYRSELVVADLLVETLDRNWEEYLSNALRKVMKRGPQVKYRADIPLLYEMFQEQRGEVDRLKKELEEERAKLGRVKERLQSALWEL